MSAVLSLLFSVRRPASTPRWRGGWALVGALVASVLMGGCAGTAPDPRDPLEPFNRRVDAFNTAVDDAVVRPVATAYRDITPDPIRGHVGNFFGNLADVWSALNTALQLRVEDTAVNLLRVGLNSTFGFAGLIDLATEMGLYRAPADFGQTLGRWGVPPGPYLVMPLFGPSTVRDTLGRGIEQRGDAVYGIDDVATRNSLIGLRLVDKRAQLLRAGEVLDGAALDKYSFTREVYLQRRQNQVDTLRQQTDD